MNLRDLLHIFKDRKGWLKENHPEKYQEKLNEYYACDLHKEIREIVEWFAKHPKLYTNQDIHFEISISNIKNKNMTLDDIIKIKEKFNKVATGIFGLYYDNCANLIMSDTFGHLYSVGVHKNNNSTYNFHLWDDSGASSLLSFTTKNNLLSKEEIDKIEKVMCNYREGIINCSDCGKEIYKHEIAGRYFAGQYCQRCWDTKWKAIEAKETYN